jgi:acetamidase/formamidase
VTNRGPNATTGHSHTSHKRVCADLRISSIVDVQNWVVSLYFPRIVLE